jgi:hypothetical protein
VEAAIYFHVLLGELVEALGVFAQDVRERFRVHELEDGSIATIRLDRVAGCLP